MKQHLSRALVRVLVCGTSVVAFLMAIAVVCTADDSQEDLVNAGDSDSGSFAGTSNQSPPPPGWYSNSEADGPFEPVGEGGQSAPAQSPEYYGAVAYDRERRVVSSASGVNAVAALAAAEQACRNQGGGDSCQALGWFTNSWASLALGPVNRPLPHGEPEGGWGFAYGYADLTAADERALALCNEDAGGGCQLVLRVGIGGSARDWGRAGPLHGSYIVDGFIEGERDHTGRDYWAVDFDTNETDPAVYPTRAGQVVFSGWDCRILGRSPRPPDNPWPDIPCYGYTVVVNHGNELSSLYNHMRKEGLPQVGQAVTPLTRIGTMSNSGCPSSEPQHSLCGTHLHYSMRRGSLADPIFSPMQAIRTPWRE